VRICLLVFVGFVFVELVVLRMYVWLFSEVVVGLSWCY